MGANQAFALDIEKAATVNELKKRIQLEKNIEPENQLLSIFGTFKPLQARKSLIDYNLHDGAKIELKFKVSQVLNDNKPFQLGIRMIDGKEVKCFVKETDTVMELRQTIFNTIGVAINEQHLFVIETKQQLNDNQRKLSSFFFGRDIVKAQIELRVAMYVKL